MEESSLRLVLLGVGAVILVGIYAYDFLKKKGQESSEQAEDFTAAERIDPVVADDVLFSAVYKEVDKQDDDTGAAVVALQDEDVVSSEAQMEEGAVEIDDVLLRVNVDVGADVAMSKSTVDVESPKSNKDVPVAEQALVIQLAVLPKDGGCFSGAALLDAFTDLNLEFGDMGIFHCCHRSDSAEVTLFHVANILEPGTFPIDSMADFESTGIVLFFQTNDSIDCELAFDEMLNAAKQLSQQFEAVLAGGDMKALTMGGISDIQSQLAGLSRL